MLIALHADPPRSRSQRLDTKPPARIGRRRRGIAKTLPESLALILPQQLRIRDADPIEIDDDTCQDEACFHNQISQVEVHA